MVYKVWGIVLVIGAAILMLSGIYGFVWSGTLTQIFIGSEQQAQSIFRNLKALSMAEIGVGFVLAAIGTILLSKVPSNHLIIRIEKEDVSTESSNKPFSFKGWKM